MRTRYFACAIALAAACGCSFEPFDLVDSTRGDEGRSEWSLSDGLCTSLGTCEMTVPVATGARVGLRVDLPDRLVAELSPLVVSGEATITNVTRDPEHETIDFDVRADAPGTIELAIVDAGGETIDRSRFEARDPAALDCGVVPASTAVTYRMSALLLAEHEVTLPAASGGAPQLACLVTDADGEPLLSVDVVHWEVRGEAPPVSVQSEQLDFTPDGSADGARVWLQPLNVEATGEATVEATLGEAMEVFAVVVE